MNPEAMLMSLRTGLTPFLGLPLQLTPAPVPGVVLGAPFDGGVLNRPGARLGPWALRAATLGLGRAAMPFRLQGHDLGGRTLAALDWVDGGNIPTRPFSITEALGAVEQTVHGWLEQGARTLLLGGDHLMTLGALRAHARKYGPLGLLHLDAHPDAGSGEAWGTEHHHGTWLKSAIQEGLVDPRHTVQLGVRAPRFDSEEIVFLLNAGVRMWTPMDLKDPRLLSQLQGDIARVGQIPAYVTVDLDVLDPAFCPAVAEPVPGGLSVLDVFTLLACLRNVAWVGADIMELAPTLPGAEDSARVAAHIALQLLS
ncbi:arginase family protein [Mesoterricola silvestris]|uniref:Agmatinase n=1 Tax=Mesoterricola silvestris TaxID=2927979 RepID=A0AA48K8J8_9BACT|nr:arginase family protein [Mesoterricola silvestris]BDU72994.1 agmatinase [Mesoterricola silvestris]